MEGGLSQEVKATIQEAYRDWLSANQFSPRKTQREMIAFIARSLGSSDSPLAVVEAGTGTGKTVAYCLAAIPIAQNLGKKLVISTATVNLQEQVYLKDLPDVQDHAGLEFIYDLVKGRGRYLCIKRLDDYLRGASQEEMPFLDEVGSDQITIYQEMLRRFSAGNWNGEVDSWEGNLDDNDWRPLTNDHRGCTNNQCAFFSQCPFFRARESLEKADVIISNHDLLLSDLALGGGVILPEPASCIYIIDEAHHIAEKTRNHFTLHSGVTGTLQWLDTVVNTLGTMTQQFSRPKDFVDLASSVSVSIKPIQQIIEEISALLPELHFIEKEEGRELHRFPLGKVPAQISSKFRDLSPHTENLASLIDKVFIKVQEAVAGEIDGIKSGVAGNWLAQIGALALRSKSLLDLVKDYGSEQSNSLPRARWVSHNDAYYDVFSAPIEPGELLNDLLWQQCYAAICTSATLTVGGMFSRFLSQAGLDNTVEQLRLVSTFNFPEVATLNVPDLVSDPRDSDAHTEEVAKLLPGLVHEDQSALILFTSWRQLNGVIRLLPDSLSQLLLVQGDDAKQVLISRHRENVLKGKSSFLVGLASFAEGLDLPGNLCRHVIIAKIPFAVPDDPIDQTVAEFLESQGRNPFYEMSLPDAALKLVQACGRLIRNEHDYGKITLLDSRIVTKSYGKLLLNTLPPYRRNIGSRIT